MEPLDPYSSVVAVLGAALLLVAAGVSKKQLVWRGKRVRRPRRRRRP